VVEMLLLLPRGVGFDPCWAILFFNVLPLIFEGGCCVAVSWRGRPGTATALAHLAGGHNRCVEWEAGAMARLLHCVGGCS
jgi:hypothetical protein